MAETPIVPWAEVEALAASRETVVWATERAWKALAPRWKAATWLDDAHAGSAAAPVATTVIAVGGGGLLDRAKLAWLGWRADAPALRLVAVPTIWGSGAEVSPVAVWTEGGKKHFKLDLALRPSAAAYHAAFATSITPEVARAACGDVWAHAVEGFLSPLASDEVRAELAALVGELLALPLAADARWFEPSGRASVLQARASVGLVHGLAHVLEPALAEASLGHARLCALFLAPVLRWNASVSSVWRELTAQYGVDREAVEAVALQLTDATALRALAPAVEAHWRTILRDPCTRTNAALVRPDSLAALRAAMTAIGEAP
jgi:alcohol dehydrogenase class IV